VFILHRKVPRTLIRSS